jgi:PhnB protein
MKITPYLFFNGNAREAIEFYSDLLGVQPGNLCRYDEMPPMEGCDVPADFGDKIGHCCLTYLSVADTPPSDPRSFADGGQLLTISCDSMEQAGQLFEKLSRDARKITWPMGEVFFAKRYGEAIDRFGVLWGVMYEGK